MSDMRLIVAGAGGRMGRTLVKAIAETKGVCLVGAAEADGSPLVGEDSGVLAGLPPNRVPLVSDVHSLLMSADGILDFTVPKATLAFAALAAEAGIVHVIGTTGLSAEDDAKIKDAAARAIVVKSGNMSLGVNLLAALVKRAAQALDEDVRHRDRRDASQQEGRRAVRHRAAARRGGGGGARHRPRRRAPRAGATA